MQFYKLFIAILLLVFTLPATAFIVEDIKIIGNERIKDDVVLSYMHFNKGDNLDATTQAEIIESLYQSGMFAHVALFKKASTLYVKLSERPAISNIEFAGNVLLKSKDIENALKELDLQSGRIFNQTILEKMRLELKKIYYSQGKYGVKMDIKVKELPRNRVDIFIQILEGYPAKIKQLNIIGNQAYDDKTLKKQIKTGIPSWWAIFSSKDKYSKPKLEGDLETLRAWYLDRGYLKFAIDSTQVSISPNKKDLFVDISLDENQKYTIYETKLAGEFAVEKSELEALVFLKKGDAFSRKRVQQVSTLIEQRLGNEGFARASVNVIPEIDEDNKRVSLTFFVDPKKRYKIRNVEFDGNLYVQDIVLRREMRQLESSWYDAAKVQRSKIRIQRLSYIAAVETKLQDVPGSSDQLDLLVTIKERMSGSFKVGAGYSEGDGLVFNLGVSKDNIADGNSLSFNFDSSKITKSASLSYNKPYFTINGVSRGYSIYYRETKADKIQSSSYILNVLGAGVDFGIPISEYSRLNLGVTIDKSSLYDTLVSPQEIKDFLYSPPPSGSALSRDCVFVKHNPAQTLCKRGEGKTYYTLTPRISFVYDTRNRSIFASEGMRQAVSVESTVPGSDLLFYKTAYNAEYFLPLFKRSVMLARYAVSYGSGYKDGLDELPPYEKFYAGGIRSVRGYTARSLTSDAKTIDSRGYAYGGDLRTTMGLEYVLPPMENNDNLRFSLFYDAGNIFSTPDAFDAKLLRTSYGLALNWITPVGPLVFSYAEPLQFKDRDRIRRFQFTIGGTF